MNSPFKAFAQVESPIVYVRPVTVADLPDELREQIGDVETVYSVHRPDGERVALVRERSMAFSLARQHDLAPVSVH
ncbi:MAG: DUF1150 family protein [Pseudotabrizicola sp.]|uniref:DUF1150 family protein n=1 Tax=Pseudotabrizicola sp. TaxID=2939647 RepID=UPI00271FF8D0|nr:DUF1150 family protein [Pseudotabrizicola sp.]MDO8883752.1 DUF1150 family protein [Pseudotabrizicola sp.]MDP2081727.1 DUF1150 family protein [Pseudotabrizicola sp.]MDZ7573022.1 DUF1150 family protein [Pseudotabrizicola sp.]